MKIVFALVFFSALGYGRNIPDSLAEDTTSEKPKSLKIAVGILITAILLLILVSLCCPKANNYKIPPLIYGISEDSTPTKTVQEIHKRSQNTNSM